MVTSKRKTCCEEFWDLKSLILDGHSSFLEFCAYSLLSSTLYRIHHPLLDCMYKDPNPEHMYSQYRHSEVKLKNQFTVTPDVAHQSLYMRLLSKADEGNIMTDGLGDPMNHMGVSSFLAS